MLSIEPRPSVFSGKDGATGKLSAGRLKPSERLQTKALLSSFVGKEMADLSSDRDSKGNGTPLQQEERNYRTLYEAIKKALREVEGPATEFAQLASASRSLLTRIADRISASLDEVTCCVELFQRNEYLVPVFDRLLSRFPTISATDFSFLLSSSGGSLSFDHVCTVVDVMLLTPPSATVADASAAGWGALAVLLAVRSAEFLERAKQGLALNAATNAVSGRNDAEKGAVSPPGPASNGARRDSFRDSGSLSPGAAAAEHLQMMAELVDGTALPSEGNANGNGIDGEDDILLGGGGKQVVQAGTKLPLRRSITSDGGGDESHPSKRSRRASRTDGRQLSEEPPSPSASRLRKRS
jgi:hypothetical protein